MNISLWFKSLGSDDGGMRMVMRGRRGEERDKQITWSMFAGDGHGPNTPSVFVVWQYAVSACVPCPVSLSTRARMPMGLGTNDHTALRV